MFFFVCEDTKWNVLDLILVIFSVADALVQALATAGGGANLTFLRALRIFKVSRALRLLRAVKFFSELRLMLDCIMGSVMTLIWCLALIVFVLYMFSLVFVQ